MAVRDPREPAKARLTAWTFQAAALGRETPESESVGITGAPGSWPLQDGGPGRAEASVRALLSTDQGGTVPTSSSRPGTALLPAATVRAPQGRDLGQKTCQTLPQLWGQLNTTVAARYHT